MGSDKLIWAFQPLLLVRCVAGNTASSSPLDRSPSDPTLSHSDDAVSTVNPVPSSVSRGRIPVPMVHATPFSRESPLQPIGSLHAIPVLQPETLGKRHLLCIRRNLL